MKKQIAVYVTAISVITRKRRFDKAPFTGAGTLTTNLAPELEGVSFITEASLNFEGRDFSIGSFREGCATGEQLVAKYCDTHSGVELEFYLDIPTSTSSRDALRDDKYVRDRFINEQGSALRKPGGGSITKWWELAHANK